MNRTWFAVVASLAAGFAAGAWTTGAPPSGESAGKPESFDPDAPIEARVAALEHAVSSERDARRVIEEQLYSLYAALERFDSPAMDELLRNLDDNSRARDQAREQRVAGRDRVARMQSLKDTRVERLVAGGFAESRAMQILQLEDEMRMAALQAQYEAQRNGDNFNPWNWAREFGSGLRGRLGDEEYEKYLLAQGRQASVTVGEVINTSPANRAGLRQGDQILSYDGKRIFTMDELRTMAFSGDPGEDVIVDIERGGQRMQLVLPRGPLGISAIGGGMGFYRAGGG